MTQLRLFAEETTAVSRQEQALGAELFNRWLAFLDRTEKTVQTYTRAIRQFSNYLEEHGIARPSREDVLNYKRSLEAEGLQPNSINSYLASLRRFFSWTETEGLYPNIAREVRSEKQSEGHKKDYLTEGQCNDLLGSVDRSTLAGQRDYAIVALMMTCGLRCIEVSRANVEDLGTVGGVSVLFVQGKGKADKAEYVKLNESTERVIRRYLMARGRVGAGAPLFTTESKNYQGKRMSTRTISGIIKEHMRAIGFEDSRHTAHSLRHTAVTRAILAGAPIQEAQQFARHANLKTTEIYFHNQEAINNTCSEKAAQGLMIG